VDRSDGAASAELEADKVAEAERALEETGVDTAAAHVPEALAPVEARTVVRSQQRLAADRGCMQAAGEAEAAPWAAGRGSAAVVVELAAAAAAAKTAARHSRNSHIMQIAGESAVVVVSTGCRKCLHPAPEVELLQLPSKQSNQAALYAEEGQVEAAAAAGNTTGSG
jgi:hypothetical protein